EVAAQAALRRLLERYPDAVEVPEALYLLGQTAEARGHPDVAALAYRQLRVLAPTTGYAEAASDRLGVLVSGGTPLPPLSMAERIDRAERLLRGGVPKTAGDEAERIADEARDAGIVVRALRVVGDAAARLGRYEAGARALEAAARHAPADQQPRLRIDQARFLIRAGQDKRAIALLTSVAARAPESEAAEARARARDAEGRGGRGVALHEGAVRGAARLLRRARRPARRGGGARRDAARDQHAGAARKPVGGAQGRSGLRAGGPAAPDRSRRV